LTHTTQNIKFSDWVVGSSTLISIGQISDPETKVWERFDPVTTDMKVLIDSDVSVFVTKLQGFSHINRPVVEYLENSISWLFRDAYDIDPIDDPHIDQSDRLRFEDK